MPSKKLNVGLIGYGFMGRAHSNAFRQANRFFDLEFEPVLKAACARNEGKLKDFAERWGWESTETDWRRLIERKDIDAINLSLPDNWHALVAIEAARNGKDIWGEKPLARTIVEQQAIVKAVTDAKRVWQTGSWQRSDDNFRIAAEIVRNGLIGKVTEVHVGLPSGHNDFAGTKDKLSVTPPPALLDYEMWIGPATMEDYIEGRIHRNWRWNYNIGGGQLLDWIGHHCDIAHWGMDCDETGGPVEIEGKGEFPERSAPWNTATTYRAELTYHNGIKMIIGGGQKDIQGGTRWIGTDGWVKVNRGSFDCSNPAFKKMVKGRDREGNVVERSSHQELADDLRKVQLPKSPTGHWGNFVECIRSRGRTIAPVNTAHHSAIPGHLTLIAMMTGRKIKWDPEKQLIVGDEAASKLLTREYRGPWKLS